jgi:8-oxo-dGTP pyrophosphatase MutT (NUDIX family)
VHVGGKMNFNRKVITAGVYVNVAGFFPFQVGPTKSGTTLGIARLGGHREGNETGWQCASREAYEEASLHVISLIPPATYWAGITNILALHMGEWLSNVPGDIAPILVTRRNEEYITPIYLCYSHDEPQPCSETKALLLLRPCEIHQIVTETITLGHYLEKGGKILFRENLPEHFFLEPLGHLQLLDKLIQLHPEITRTMT